MIILIFMFLTIITAILSIASKEETSTKHRIMSILTIYQLLVVYSTYQNDGIVDFWAYPISYWVGFFWASIISVIISAYMYIKSLSNED